ncbi:Npun_F0494 family protein [Cyanobium sp. ATX-6F1]|uniref:Npun_F0494 family protein n=1 Tax=Cyanobium sp. ATX-6F1 TaxID=3137388 RepID=UPI0039BDA728
MIDGDGRSRARAWRAMGCLPFRRALYERLAEGGVSAEDLSAQEAVPHWLQRPLSRRQAEQHLAWLIRLGLIRWEVDGQGLTDRVRLTPMGRQLLRQWPGEIPSAGPLARLRDALRRHWPL